MVKALAVSTARTTAALDSAAMSLQCVLLFSVISESGPFDPFGMSFEHLRFDRIVFLLLSLHA